ncbi:MAG TPA: DUF445 domain-containing protein [Albitalea sp.]|nr:DUF445 domain-containing protein [Albitalea sp.]
MKRIALGLLGAAAALYVIATLLQPRHWAWGYAAAFAEAAMVGAIADWFAVVALFRHPLGLPIPHTAIIPSNKDRIGDNLAHFIVANFLTTEQVLDKLARLDVAARLANWLAQPGHARQVTQHLASALRYALGALDDERVRHFFRGTVLEQLERVDVARLAGQVLDVLTIDGRHQGLLDAGLRKLADTLDNEALKARLAEVIASEVKYLRYVGMDHVAGRYATAKLVAGVIRLVGEMAHDPAHPLRGEFDQFVAGFIGRLKEEPQLRERVEAVKRELLASPALGGYLQGLWSDVIAWVQADLTSDASALRSRAATAIQVVGEKLQGDPAMQAWINEQLRSAAPGWIERYREDIRRYIVARVAQWNTQEMTDELERNIGRDLQFIRVNGTLVGGIVGLAIHAATQWARAL